MNAPTHAMRNVLVTACLIVLTALAAGRAASAVPAGGPDAHDLADLALVASADHRYADAAQLLDRAFDDAPHPLYRLAAAEAYLRDGETVLADRRVSAALANPTLPPAARTRGEALLARARAAAVHVGRARAARPAEAARAWEQAFEVADVGRFLAQSAASWEAARRFEDAAATYARAAQRDDLPPDVAVAVAAGLVRSRAAIPPPPPDLTAAWITTGTAAAALAFAGAALLTSNGYHDDVRGALAHLEGGVVTGITRAEAQRQEALADSWQTAGWVGLGVGAGLLATSVILFATAPDAASTSNVRLEAAAGPGGVMVFASGSL